MDSAGNFYRICSAFKYGARKLGQILLLPHERLVDELNKFFANTLERHENQCWTDGQDGFSSNDDLSLIQHSETCCEDSKFLTSLTPDYSNKITRFRNDSSRDLLKVIPSAYKEKVDSSQVLPELNCTLDRNSLSGRHLAEEAKGVAIEILSSKNRYDLSSSLPLNSYIGISLLGKSQPALALCNEKIDNGNLHGRIPLKSVHIDDMSFALWSESKENTLATSSSFCLYGNRESIVPKKLSLLTPVPNVLVNSSSALREQNLTSILGSSERSKCLLDLSGNYESYFSSLLYGKCYYLSAAVLLNPRISHQSQHKSLQETVWQSLQLEPEAYSKMSRNGDLGHQFYPLNPSMPSNFAFSSDEKKKSRGIGTYFPNMNYLSNRDRLLSGRERSQARGNHGQLQRYRNGLVSAPTKMNLRGESQEEFPVLGNGKAQFSDSYQPRPSVWGSSNANDISHPLERHESPSHGHRLREVTLPEARTQPDSDTSQCDYSSSPVVPKSQCPKLSITSSQDRVKEQSYHLKNEVDFPPLSLLRMVKI
ncbi:hypothetical protein Patl1_34999 [Pistacia atlantica]|uniref:Uncharacterized protein n=1 Tax=Pistacia atlantica TaxID=434234 RepID=A0ACC0ZVN5_9ROSI|nr:hypothetical protein Patl1_34999 [Pistacia atlantica]